MIQKRAKPEKIARLRDALTAADAALCEAGRLNARGVDEVLTLRPLRVAIRALWRKLLAVVRR